MKKLLLLLLISVATFAQKTIHNYEYIIVKKQFDFVKQPDKYQTSSLTKFLFNKEGFKTFIEGEEMPKEIISNNCLVLKANVKDASNMLWTKSTIELRNCFNEIIFTSSLGTSKMKDYKKGYHEAIRKAFESVKSLNYSYKPLSKKEKKIITPDEKSDEKKMISSDNKVSDIKEEINTHQNAQNDNPFKDNRLPVLYAERTTDGFKLLNLKKEIVFTLLNTSLKEVFVIKNKNGVFYKEDKDWIAEFYFNDKKALQSDKKVLKEYDVRMTPVPNNNKYKR